MFRYRRLIKLFKIISKRFRKQWLSVINKQLIWLLRTFVVTKKRRSSANAGFVLPTVVMVSLVVVLITTAILFRSFERSKNASNVRVNEAVLSAASPALDRAKAKIDQLFRDPRLPRSTPSDLSLAQVFTDNLDEFTFGDETQLKVVKEFNSQSGIQDEETLNTAWKYPVDTDNDGMFDSFTLYGIYFRTPTTNRARSPLEARTQPMDEGASGGQCSSDVATSANLVGTQGWYKVGGKLKRSIYVYTTTLPITVTPDAATFGNNYTKYEKFTGNKGFAALEYQQDRARIPLNNNAVLYEDDLAITPGFGINLNGRIFTNGNLLTRKSGYDIRFYLVSSPKSCYYTEENSKIIVAGNVINSRVVESGDGSGVQVDLFDKDYDVNNSSIPNYDYINGTQKTVPSEVYGNTAAYNDEAYAQRIDRLVQQTNTDYPNKGDLPDDVQLEIERQMAADSSLTEAKVRDEQLRIYFKQRTRRVPYAEIGVGKDAVKDGANDYTTSSPILRENKNALRPANDWAFPYDPSDGTTATSYAKIGIKENNNKLYLSATEPAVQVEAGKEERIGDRILVGNNLPQYWYDTIKGKFFSSEEGQTISGKEWDNNNKPRKRFTQAYQLDDLGITDRDDFWEKAAAQKPQGPLDIVGGLRVVTGAGIYLPNDYAPGSHTFTDTEKIVWADNMPMGVTTKNQGLPNDKTPYLQMRATAVYHYQDSFYDPKTPGNYQSPIACVSSYYNPTNSTTARNSSKDFGNKDLPDVSLRDTKLASPNRNVTPNTLPNITSNPGKSNNGVVYAASSLSTTGYGAELNYQAQLKYPNGEWVNNQLREAMANITAGKNLTLAQQSAVDSAMCALKILDGNIGAPVDTAIPHGAIMETAFLDARQIKAIDKPSTTARTYDLDVELRQPLEIRATVIDLDLLRRKSKTNEFLLPNSGIIYATRDDALADNSNASPDVSATDFKLDPNRRPNAVMLINGSNLSRNATYKPEEKGLILASNLPVYIQGNFNVHTQEEFTDNSLVGETNWSSKFYKRQTLNPQFACRKDQFSSCTIGEDWRPATVVADAITVLSGNFRLGFREEGDYDLRNNYGNFPVGYDFDGIGGINSATNVTLDEKAIKFDVNGDGDMEDETVSTIDENKPAIDADLNGDGDKTDMSVQITESNITATVAARLNGFWDNNFVTSHNFTDSQYSGSTTGRVDSSYFNNFITPIQRRVTFSEYVMEICRKPTVTACTPSDWVVGYDFNDDDDLEDSEVDLNTDLNGDGNKQTTVKEKDIKANQMIAASDSPNPNAYTADPVAAPNASLTRFGAGTTAQAAMLEDDRRYPRRVAFLRDANNNLRLFNSSPVPMGINSIGKVNYYPYSDQVIDSKNYSAYSSFDSSKRPRGQGNTLWFRTSNSTGGTPLENYDPQYPLWIEENRSRLTGTRPTEQPLLVPVLQIQYPFISPSDTSALTDTGDVRKNGNWIQTATATETNLVFAQGNTPERPSNGTDTGEFNGGLENFVRYLERWQNGSSDSNLVNHTATGAFIQFKRSSYATAPWQTFTAPISSDTTGYTTSATGTIFRYPQGYRLTVTQVGSSTLGRTSFYTAPNRFWGYDVALLTQLPDLFSQRFTSPATGDPNEFYREVSRDDDWVKNLLCAAQNTSYGYGNAPTEYGTDYNYALSPDQRGTCP